MNKAQLNRLLKLERDFEALKKQLGVSGRGEIIFQAPRSMWSEWDVVVEADGRGGAKLMIVDGRSPGDDVTSHREESFPTEDAACEAAERLVSPTK